MNIIDWDIFRKSVLNTIKHHGTRTQGEDFRLEQVSDCIVELVHALVSAKDALDTVEGTRRTIVYSVRY